MGHSFRTSEIITKSMTNANIERPNRGLKCLGNNAKDQGLGGGVFRQSRQQVIFKAISADRG